MTALLALYMVQQLLTPGHAEHVLGLAALRRPVRGARADGRPGLRLADLRLVFGPRLFHPDPRRPLADRLLGTSATVVHRRAADERRPYRDGVRRELPDRARAADRRLGLPQGQYLGAGRPALSRGGGIAARRRAIRSSRRGDQYRRGRRARWPAARVAAAYGWHAGFALRRRADDRRADHLSRRAAPSARRRATQAETDRLSAADRRPSAGGPGC